MAELKSKPDADTPTDEQPRPETAADRPGNPTDPPEEAGDVEAPSTDALDDEEPEPLALGLLTVPIARLDRTVTNFRPTGKAGGNLDYLTQSIDELGLPLLPPIVNADGVVIQGHERIRWLEEQGKDKAEVLVINAHSPVVARAHLNLRRPLPPSARWRNYEALKKAYGRMNAAKREAFAAIAASLGMRVLRDENKKIRTDDFLARLVDPRDTADTLARIGFVVQNAGPNVVALMDLGVAPSAAAKAVKRAQEEIEGALMEGRDPGTWARPDTWTAKDIRRWAKPSKTEKGSHDDDRKTEQPDYHPTMEKALEMLVEIGHVDDHLQKMPTEKREDLLGRLQPSYDALRPYFGEMKPDMVQRQEATATSEEGAVQGAVAASPEPEETAGPPVEAAPTPPPSVSAIRFLLKLPAARVNEELTGEDFDRIAHWFGELQQAHAAAGSQSPEG